VYESIDHVGVVVEDIARAAEWYQDNLAWRICHKEYVADAGAFLAYLLPEDVELGDGAASLQLVQPVEPGPLLDHLHTHGEGIHHLCLKVKDITVALTGLSEDPDRVFTGGRNQLACFLEKTPTGVRIELTGSVASPVPGGST